MAKFSTGFVIGAAAGTVYALLTAKKSGPERQRAISHYFDDVTHATSQVQSAVSRFGNALSALQKEMHTTFEPAMKDINDAVEDFNYQTQPHIKSLNDHLEKVEKIADDLNVDPAPEKSEADAQDSETDK